MTNNFDLIKDLLKFDSDDDFYHIQILRRRKENPNMSSNSKVVRDYYVSSLEYLESKKEEIVKLCNVFNARATIRLNKRSYRKCAWNTLKILSDTMFSNNFRGVRRVYSKAVGRSPSDPNKTWILDLDEEHLTHKDLIYQALNHENLKPDYDKIIKEIPSKSGVHLICKPFNVKDFKTICNSLKIPNIEIHKDNPTNLFIT